MSTKRSYATHRIAYFQFGNRYKLTPTPIMQQVTRYVAHLSHKLSPVSIPKYLNILRIMHLEQGLPDHGVLNMHEVQAVLTGIGKDKEAAIKRMKSITPALLISIHDKLTVSSVADASMWAACLLGFCGMLRRSNLFPPSLQGFQSNKHLSKECISITGASVTVALKWTKTIWKKTQSLEVLLLALPGSPLCPVTALHGLINLTQDVPPSSPVFWQQGKRS